MRLSSQPLKNVDSVNAFEHAEAWYARQDGSTGEATSLYFQIVDLDREGSNKEPLRYMPLGTVVTLSVTFPNLDDALEFSVSATQPYADDKSIWRVDIPADKLPASGNVQFSLTIDGVTRKWSTANMLLVDMLNSGCC